MGENTRTCSVSIRTTYDATRDAILRGRFSYWKKRRKKKVCMRRRRRSIHHRSIQLFLGSFFYLFFFLPLLNRKVYLVDWLLYSIRRRVFKMTIRWQEGCTVYETRWRTFEGAEFLFYPLLFFFSILSVLEREKPSPYPVDTASSTCTR